jgi:hypothetical protein
MDNVELFFFMSQTVTVVSQTCYSYCPFRDGWPPQKAQNAETKKNGVFSSHGTATILVKGRESYNIQEL